jgi:segregation and condensation protein A
MRRKHVEEFDKPFWLRPPYVILFDLLRLHRIKPWDVNISNLLNAFLAEMKRQGFVDFSASGTALLSSATIHRMKSELVLKMEEPPRPPQARPDEFVPPPLPFPIRFEYTATSIEQVLGALQEVLKTERVALAQSKFVLQPPQVLEQLDEFLANIEENLEQFYSKIVNLAIKGPVSFRKLIRGQTLIEIVRIFVMLLFLANQKRIRLSQSEERADIEITLGQEAAAIA